MKEIKFRAWDKIDNIMRTLFLLNSKGVPLEVGFVDPQVREPEELILMQFTGLHDKKGKEIYEGDIIKKNSRDSFGYEVYWHIYTACWRLRHPHRSGFTGIDKGDCALMCEIIGNIHENPELLEKGV